MNDNDNDEGELQLVTTSIPDCPLCGHARHVHCDECGNKWEQCICIDSLMGCEACLTFFEWVPSSESGRGTLELLTDEVTYPSLHDDDDDDWSWGEDDDLVMKNKRGNKRNGGKKTVEDSWYGYGGDSKWSKWDDWPKANSAQPIKTCDHLMTPVVFTNNGESVTIYASAGRHQRTRTSEQHPDFGLYADHIWHPVSRNEFINWPDFKTPMHSTVAAMQIVDAFIMACEGKRVEVGCIGGHGRTGTILACMGVMAGLDPDSSIDFVRSSYCDHAVETRDQEAWVKWFHGYLFAREEAK
jgi:hypothetical protein